ncbi:hypothetical protein TorRG33x02_274090 [Trema orientale]|uniref:Uncharacterized protein n=1 Tax=Trema orientale TaxID=63057 RepID=A0A2P5CSM2_TREOI|nr:hypothetical protein TorRG33x02_274090 [Trema orientale]
MCRSKHLIYTAMNLKIKSQLALKIEEQSTNLITIRRKNIISIPPQSYKDLKPTRILSFAFYIFYRHKTNTSSKNSIFKLMLQKRI